MSRRKEARQRERSLMASGMRKPATKTYLLEECVIKSALNLGEKHPIWGLFDREGPIIRCQGTLMETEDGTLVILQTEIGRIAIEESNVQEVVE